VNSCCAECLGSARHDAAGVIQQTFVREGIKLILQYKLRKVERRNAVKIIHCRIKWSEVDSLAVGEILAGAGRAQMMEGLNLEAVSVKSLTKGGVSS